MPNAKEIYQPILDQIKTDGLYKTERTITTRQGVRIGTVEAGEVATTARQLPASGDG